MNIAYTMGSAPGETDLLLADLAADLQSSGLRLAGTVQINSERERSCRCDMDVKVLPAGPHLRISQDLGTGSKGCRLDPSSLEIAVGLTATQLDNRQVDCLIVNKFGKQEAEGRGFRPVIAQAMSRDIPVLIGISRLNTSAFCAFTENLATFLDPDPVKLKEWVMRYHTQPMAS